MNSIHIDAHQHFWICRHDEYDWIDNSMAALRLNFLPEELALELNQKWFRPTDCATGPPNTGRNSLADRAGRSYFDSLCSRLG